MIKRLTSLLIKGEQTTIPAVDVLEEDGRVFFVADADIDCDGSGGNPEHDPWFQPDTTYHHDGKALNAYKVPFIVVPPSIIKLTRPAVLGCLARLTYIKTGKSTDCIVGDIGPKFKLGECSPCAATRVGIPPSPVNGGVSDYNLVAYEIWPGEMATIDGITYALQPRS